MLQKLGYRTLTQWEYDIAYNAVTQSAKKGDAGLQAVFRRPAQPEDPPPIFQDFNSLMNVLDTVGHTEKLEWISWEPPDWGKGADPQLPKVPFTVGVIRNVKEKIRELVELNPTHLSFDYEVDMRSGTRHYTFFHNCDWWKETEMKLRHDELHLHPEVSFLDNKVLALVLWSDKSKYTHGGKVFHAVCMGLAGFDEATARSRGAYVRLGFLPRCVALYLHALLRQDGRA